MLVTSKLKSSLMLFIFKCSPLDRRHLVWHASQGRPWCSALLGSITLRQPFGTDTKAVGLARDLLWNLSQSCNRHHDDEKHKCTELLVYTHAYLSTSARLPPQHLAPHRRWFSLFTHAHTNTHTKESPLKIRQFIFCAR